MTTPAQNLKPFRLPKGFHPIIFQSPWRKIIDRDWDVRPRKFEPGEILCSIGRYYVVERVEQYPTQYVTMRRLTQKQYQTRKKSA
jgi:hypothetical protein